MKTLRSLALVAATGTVLSCSSLPTVSTRLHSPEGEVLGVAVLRVVPEGTHAAVKLGGLQPGAVYRAVVNAGTCERSGASFLSLSTFKADGEGRARAGGRLLFRGREPIELGVIADGAHVVRIVGALVLSGEVEDVACGVVPRL